MATRIRLRRMGRKKQPSYRIVVADRASARDGAFIEALGHYNPRSDPAIIQVDASRARHWLESGATPSYTVRSLFKRAGVFSAETTGPAGAPEVAGEAEAVPAADESATEGAEPSEG